MSILNLVDKHFSLLGFTFCNRTDRIVTSLLDCYSVNTSKIARSMAKKFNLSQDAAAKFVQRAFDDDSLQLNDRLWRQYSNMVFSFLEEKTGLKADDEVQINVDFTSVEDRFMVLCGSLIVNNEKAILLYFSMRRYPKKSGQFNQKKMEAAFFNELEHFLPKKYKYIIVADRGFGHERVIENCENLGFFFALRRTENLNIIVDGEKKKLEDFEGQNCIFEAEVPAWKGKKIKFAVNSVRNEETGKTSTWYIMTNLENDNIKQIYEMRFKIEKLFQDFKKSGFDLESSKFKAYNKIKRLIFFVGFAHVITTFAGFFAKYVKKSTQISVPHLQFVQNWNEHNNGQNFFSTNFSCLAFK